MLWKAAVNIVIIFVSNALIAIVTEEGMSPRWVLLATSVAFSLRHLPGATPVQVRHESLQAGVGIPPG